ncbi:hypothetical protein OSTOST_21580, partial [Ostertagia ostertagi]
MLRERNIDICALQETKWSGAKTKRIGGYSLYYKGERSKVNGVAIAVSQRLEHTVKDIQRISDRIIYDSDGVLLYDFNKIKNRWQEYFQEICNVEFPHPPPPKEPQIHGPIPRISENEVKEAVKKMKNMKATGPDDIPVEVWRQFGGYSFLTELFNNCIEKGVIPKDQKASQCPFIRRKETLLIAPAVVCKKRHVSTECVNKTVPARANEVKYEHLEDYSTYFATVECSTGAGAGPMSPWILLPIKGSA